MKQAAMVSAMLLLVTRSPVMAQSRPMVLELFTSQGCSSCPPAEAYIQELSHRPGVLPLAFHVDYWDGLGWRDRFANPAFTQRQRTYAGALPRGGLYTPQAVIDGIREFVGSDRRGIEATLAGGAANGVETRVQLKDDGIEIAVGGLPSKPPADVLLVTYLHETTTAIGRGENAGRTVQESNVVRSIRLVGRWDGNPGEYRVPLSGLPADATHAAVLIQARGPGLIFGAASLPLR
jgi:hypothetical protein